MTFNELAEAIEDAEVTMRRADAVTDEIVVILRGRLRQVGNTWALADLKRELRDFNMQTLEWRD